MEKEKYHYTECGLDYVWLLNGFEISKDEDGNEEIFIHDIHELHKAIGLMIVCKPGKLCGEEIRFIRHTMDLSQKSMARLLGVSYQSVLGWEKNKTNIQKQTDHFLRTLFFAYLDTATGKVIYEKINEIADLDAEITQCHQELIEFEKDQSDDWQRVA